MASNMEITARMSDKDCSLTHAHFARNQESPYSSPRIKILLGLSKLLDGIGDRSSSPGITGTHSEPNDCIYESPTKHDNSR